MAAAGLGVEPRCHDSESCILPLDDPAIRIAFMFLLSAFCFYTILKKICLFKQKRRPTWSDAAHFLANQYVFRPQLLSVQCLFEKFRLIILWIVWGINTI